MKVSMQKTEDNIVKLEITVEVEKFNEALNKSFRKNAKRFDVPGFRKGKAPMSVIKRHYGEGVLYEDAVNFCIEDTYPKALDEQNINPVDYPKVDIVQVGEGKDLVYTAEVTVKPEVEIGEYKGLEVKKVEYPVNDEEVQKELERLQNQNGRVMTKEDGTVEKGNIAVIDFEGFVDDKQFPGGTAKNFELEIGSGMFIDNFEDQLVGLKKGEAKDVNVKFPENYGKEELNGKPALFKVVINEIKEKQLPALDDELAKESSEFDTLEELKADIKKKLEESNKRRETAEFQSAVLDAVCENAKINIPQVMIDKEVDFMFRDFAMKLKYQGLDINTYYQYTGSSEEKVKEGMVLAATKSVKARLVLEKLAEIEKVEVTQEEVKAKAEEVARGYGYKEDKIAKVVENIIKSEGSYLEGEIKNQKVLEFLIDNCKVVA